MYSWADEPRACICMQMDGADQLQAPAHGMHMQLYHNIGWQRKKNIGIDSHLTRTESELELVMEVQTSSD